MANQERTFQAGDQTYTIRFTQNALYKLDKQLDMPLAMLSLKVGPVVLQTMMWAGLEGARLKNKPPSRKPFTIEEVGDIIDEMGGMKDATPIILDAWKSALAKASDKNAEAKEPEAPDAGPTQA